jgi:nucleotide-binding universal stress UspA family protein
MPRRILVATDGSEHARKAIEMAAEIAVHQDAEVFLVHVIPKAEIPEDLRRFMDTEYAEEPAEVVYPELIGHSLMDEAVKEFKRKGVKSVHKEVLQGDPAHEIVSFAEQNHVETIFIGSRGLGNLKGLLVGSVANKVCHTAECTCVTVK